jgi:hypothetical protein
VKKYIVLLFLAFSFTISAQTSDTLTPEDIIAAATKIKNSEDTIALQRVVISNLNAQIDSYTKLLNSATTIDSMRIMQIDILNNTINSMRGVYSEKPWYKSDQMYFIYGTIMMFGATYAASRL